MSTHETSEAAHSSEGEALRHSEEPYQALIEHSTDIIVLLNATGLVTYISPSITPILGYTSQEVVGVHGLSLIHPDDLEIMQQVLEDILQEPGKSLRAEYRLRHKNGSYCWFEGSGTNLLSVPGVQAIVGNFRDITEHRQAEEERIRLLAREEEEIKEREARWRFMAESMPQKIFTAQPNGDIDYFNQQWMEFTGLSFEQIKDWGWIQFVHPDDIDENIRRWQHSLDTGEPFYFEHRFRRADGVYRWHVSRVIPMRDAEGTITMWIGSNTDIDEQKRQEERKDEFIRMVSHELKTPVTSLKGFTYLLQRSLASNSDARGRLYLERMDVQLTKLTRLISDMIDLSKIQTDKLLYKEELLDLDALVHDIVEQVQATTTTHHLRYTAHISAQLLGDRDRLGQVFINLFSNAIKYSPGADTIIITLTNSGEDALVSIEDFGIGIAQAHHEHIFERFYQVPDPLEKTFPGLGIGLYLSRQIIQRHQGQLWVESHKGQGSIFYASLPVRKITLKEAKT